MLNKDLLDIQSEKFDITPDNIKLNDEKDTLTITLPESDKDGVDNMVITYDGKATNLNIVNNTNGEEIATAIYSISIGHDPFDPNLYGYEYILDEMVPGDRIKIMHGSDTTMLHISINIRKSVDIQTLNASDIALRGIPENIQHMTFTSSGEIKPYATTDTLRKFILEFEFAGEQLANLLEEDGFAKFDLEIRRDKVSKFIPFSYRPLLKLDSDSVYTRFPSPDNRTTICSIPGVIVPGAKFKLYVHLDASSVAGIVDKSRNTKIVDDPKGVFANTKIVRGENNPSTYLDIEGTLDPNIMSKFTDDDKMSLPYNMVLGQNINDIPPLFSRSFLDDVVYPLVVSLFDHKVVVPLIISDTIKPSSIAGLHEYETAASSSGFAIPMANVNENVVAKAEINSLICVPIEFTSAEYLSFDVENDKLLDSVHITPSEGIVEQGTHIIKHSIYDPYDTPNEGDGLDSFASIKRGSIMDGIDRLMYKYFRVTKLGKRKLTINDYEYTNPRRANIEVDVIDDASEYRKNLTNQVIEKGITARVKSYGDTEKLYAKTKNVLEINCANYPKPVPSKSTDNNFIHKHNIVVVAIGSEGVRFQGSGTNILDSRIHGGVEVYDNRVELPLMDMEAGEGYNIDVYVTWTGKDKNLFAMGFDQRNFDIFLGNCSTTFTLEEPGTGTNDILDIRFVYRLGGPYNVKPVNKFISETLNTFVSVESKFAIAISYKYPVDKVYVADLNIPLSDLVITNEKGSDGRGEYYVLDGITRTALIKCVIPEGKTTEMDLGKGQSVRYHYATHDVSVEGGSGVVTRNLKLYHALWRDYRPPFKWTELEQSDMSIDEVGTPMRFNIGFGPYHPLMAANSEIAKSSIEIYPSTICTYGDIQFSDNQFFIDVTVTEEGLKGIDTSVLPTTYSDTRKYDILTYFSATEEVSGSVKIADITMSENLFK